MSQTFPNIKRFEMLDHTIPNLPCENSKFVWDQKGLGPGSPEDPPDLVSLASLLSKNGDKSRTKILKIDCEGCEYDAIEQMNLSDLLSFTHIFGELHNILGKN